jgi:hypothetical protein
MDDDNGEMTEREKSDKDPIQQRGEKGIIRWQRKHNVATLACFLLFALFYSRCWYTGPLW